MSIAKKERWTEDEVLALPSGEHDYFDRKSGALLNDRRKFEESLSKALSAFSNSGGGYLLLGVRDDGTFDGVVKNKGRQSTRDWIEQVAPNLLDYPLQDIRVHEVEPSTPSAIPPGSVLIVIDVGDSNLAPHQSRIDHIYYYRVGSHSLPAPHFYLETLRGRDRYPSQEVARTWRDVVLNPMIDTLNREQEYLASGKWTWSVHRQSLPELTYIGSRRTKTGNHEEFLEFYPEIENQMTQHDLAATLVYGRCMELYNAIVSSSALLEAYQEAISPSELQRLRDSNSRLTPYATDEALLGELFGSPSTTEENLKYLAEFIVNKGINYNSTIRPFWELHREKFLNLLNAPPVNDFENEANSARDKLQRFNEQLIGQLRTIRTNLVRKHGIPVEEIHKRW